MSPSRLMAIMDPLLNTGFLWRCLGAYAGIKADNEPPHDELSSAKITTTTNASDNSPEKRLKFDTGRSSPNQIVPEEKQTSQNPERMRADTYYTRLSN
jgi:hormone-sensitive lipase